MLRLGWRLKQCIKLLHVDTLHQVFVVPNRVARTEQGVCIGKAQWGDIQESFDLRGECGQHGLEVDGQQAEGFDAGAAHVLQARVGTFLFGQFPGFVGVHVRIDAVGQQHGLAQGFGVVAAVEQGCNALFLGADGAQQFCAIGRYGAQFACKPFGNKTRRAAGDVDVFADQVAVHPRHEVVGVEVDVFVLAIEFGGQVVPQPLGVHAQAQVLQRVEAGAAALAHFFAVVHGQKAVHKDRIRCFAAAELQHGGPEKRVEGDDVLADEVVLLQLRLRHVSLVILAAFVEQVFQRCQVTHGRVQPHVEVFARRVGNLDAEVGRVAADVPVTQAFAGGAVGVGAHGEPLFDLVGHLGLQAAVLRPAFQKRHAAWVGQLKEQMFGAF